jgi:hypothetical protein
LWRNLPTIIMHYTNSLQIKFSGAPDLLNSVAMDRASKCKTDLQYEINVIAMADKLTRNPLS